MSLTENQIEIVLRHVPSWNPPARLKEQLLADSPLGKQSHRVSPASKVLSPGGWLRRWWPVLAPGCVSLACALVFTVQQQEIRKLRENIISLSQPVGPERSSGAPVSKPIIAPSQDSLAQQQNEIARLRELAARLSSQVTELETLRAQNNKLRLGLA